MIGPEARDRICRSVVSVRAKLILALLLATVPTVGVLAYFGLESTSGLLRSQALDRMGMLAMAQAREMEDAIEHAIGDARYLARSPAVRAFARVCAGRDAPSDEARTHLLEEFVALAEASALYCQIRYLDGAGHERARIDYDGRRAHIVPERGLQDKSDRYYFREAMAAAPNEVYVSPLDLNRENGQFEQPLRPVLRFVSPVVDDGSGSGVVVLNLQAGPLLPTIRQGVSAAFVADPDGWYLSHTDAAKAWSGPENLNTGQHLRADFGRQANAVVRPEPATVQASGHLVGTWPIMINSPPRRSYLVVGVQEAEATAFAAQRDFRRFFWTLIGISFVIPVLAGLALAAYFLRPLGKLRGAVHAVAEGDLEAAADVNSCDEFQELADDFNAMAARLREHHEEERLALVGRMASGLTHDIKNALSSTTAFARLLAASDLSDEERESMADRAVAQVGRVVGMLQEILDFSRGEGGEPETRLVAVEELLADLKPELEADCAQRGIRLVVEANGRCDMHADPDKLRRAIVNIATNALEAMADGGTLTLRSTHDGYGARIAIADTGPGLPDEMEGRLFEPFVSHGKPNGTGLGLAIASSIVGAHGGCLEGANQPNGGAVFTIWLPAAHQSAS